MKKLFILSGGPGREHEVSLSSGKNIVEILRAAEIPFDTMVIQKDGTWEHGGKIISESEGLALLKESNALIFQVIHGTYGEDGKLATLLEERNISYIGSTSEVMRLTIDKYQTEKKLRKSDIHTTESTLVNTVSDIENIKVSFPAMVKPKDEGSSVALSKVKNEQGLKETLEKTVPIYGAMLVQTFVIGREFTCGVIEIDGKVQALVPTEIILTKGETFDYEAKYTVGGSKEVTPADIDADLTNKIQDLAVQVHTTCGCKDISRTDMILNDKGELVVLEINTVPGMTKTSFIPAQLQASGFSAVGFIEGMIQKYS